MQNETKLDKLSSDLERTSQMRRTAELLGGKITVGDSVLTIQELKEFEADLKARIAVIISNNQLRLVK